MHAVIFEMKIFISKNSVPGKAEPGAGRPGWQDCMASGDCSARASQYQLLVIPRPGASLATRAEAHVNKIRFLRSGVPGARRAILRETFFFRLRWSN